MRLFATERFPSSRISDQDRKAKLTTTEIGQEMPHARDGQWSTAELLQKEDLASIKEKVAAIEETIRHIGTLLDSLPDTQNMRWNYGDPISTLSTAELMMRTCFEIQPWTSMSKKIRCPCMGSQVTQNIGEYETQLKSHGWHKLREMREQSIGGNPVHNGISRCVHARLIRLVDGRQWLLVGSTVVCLPYSIGSF